MQPWNETLQFGPPEFKAMALAHAIILGIAAIRYWVRPWWAARRVHLAADPTLAPVDGE
jgi:hypothetical protein